MRQVCYAKSYVLTFDRETESKLPVWVEEDEVFQVRMISKKMLDKPMSTRWIKKKTDKNCLSEDPDDCLVWYQAEVPPTYRITKDYIDETQENFSTDEFFRNNFENLTGSLQWHPVLCEELVTDKVMEELVRELKYEKYLPEHTSNKLSKEVWTALFKYQIAFELPVGNLNLATLNFMNLEY